MDIRVNTATVAVEPSWMEDQSEQGRSSQWVPDPHSRRGFSRGFRAVARRPTPTPYSIPAPAPVTLRQLRLPGNEAPASSRGRWSEAVEWAAGWTPSVMWPQVDCSSGLQAISPEKASFLRRRARRLPTVLQWSTVQCTQSRGGSATGHYCDVLPYTVDALREATMAATTDSLVVTPSHGRCSVRSVGFQVLFRFTNLTIHVHTTFYSHTAESGPPPAMAISHRYTGNLRLRAVHHPPWPFPIGTRGTGT